MDTLKILLGFLLKIAGAILMVLIYVFAVEYHHGLDRADGILYGGYSHLYRTWGFFETFALSFVPTIALWLLASLSGFLRLSPLKKLFSKMMIVMFVGAIGFVVIGITYQWFLELSRQFTVAQLVVGHALGLAGVYVGYFIAAFLVDAFGRQFEMLADALPRGRAVLFSEAFSAGYNKPQTVAFINELSVSEASINYTHTTFFLYVIPFLTFIGMLVRVVFFA